MTLLETVDLFIEELEADLQEISGEIREETNYEDCNLDWLTEQYDLKEEHLENLKQIKHLLITNNLIKE